MPTYQYACTDPACAHRFEAVQSVSDESLTVCPVCQGRLRKVFSAVGVVFKGSGFYRNDSRSSSNGKSPAGSPKSAESKPTESKPTESSSTASSSSSSSDSGSSSSSDAGSRAAAS